MWAESLGKAHTIGRPSLEQPHSLGDRGCDECMVTSSEGTSVLLCYSQIICVIPSANVIQEAR